MKNLKEYHQFINEAAEVTWIVVSKFTKKVVLNTKNEDDARKKASESSEYVLYFRRGQDPVRRA